MLIFSQLKIESRFLVLFKHMNSAEISDGGRHIDSLKSFYSTGIKQPTPIVFLVEPGLPEVEPGLPDVEHGLPDVEHGLLVEGMVKNVNGTTDEDYDISETLYRVVIPGINFNNDVEKS
jgi:hypothetical protein